MSQRPKYNSTMAAIFVAIILLQLIMNTIRQVASYAGGWRLNFWFWVLSSGLMTIVRMQHLLSFFNPLLPSSFSLVNFPFISSFLPSFTCLEVYMQIV